MKEIRRNEGKKHPGRKRQPRPQMTMTTQHPCLMILVKEMTTMSKTKSFITHCKSVTKMNV